MKEEQRFCRKCPPGGDGAGASFDLEGYIGRIPAEERVPEEEYERRLSLCASCGRLRFGVCGLCGCYVQLRAMMRARDCPDVPARWGRHDCR